MRLLLDAGNSRLKWAMVAAGTTPVTGSVTPDSDGLAALAAQMTASGRPARIALVSVRGEPFERLLADFCAQHQWPEPFIVRVADKRDGIQPAYPSLETLGVDRYAAMVGARRLFEGPLVVVDCGTAVTVDAVDSHGRHLGGLILPGLALMRRALSEGTAALPDVDRGAVAALACSTADAIVSGTALGLVSAVDGLCRRASARLEGEPVYVLTGGDAGLLESRGSLTYTWCPWLVFQGAYFIMEGESCDPWRSC